MEEEKGRLRRNKKCWFLSVDEAKGSEDKSSLQLYSLYTLFATSLSRYFFFTTTRHFPDVHIPFLHTYPERTTYTLLFLIIFVIVLDSFVHSSVYFVLYCCSKNSHPRGEWRWHRMRCTYHGHSRRGRRRRCLLRLLRLARFGFGRFVPLLFIWAGH